MGAKNILLRHGVRRGGSFDKEKLCTKYCSYRNYYILYNDSCQYRFLKKVDKSTNFLVDNYFFSEWFIYSFCHTDRSGAYLVIRSTILYSSRFLDCAINCSARNDTASKHELMPTLKALRVRLESRLFLLPLKSFCNKNLLGIPLFFSAWRNLVVRSAVLYTSRFLDYARNDRKNRAPEKICFAKIFGKKEQSHLRLTVYHRKWLT